MRRRQWEEEEWEEEYVVRDNGFQPHDPFATPTLENDMFYNTTATPNQCLNVQSLNEFVEADENDRPTRRK